jgi:hypothetical protein
MEKGVIRIIMGCGNRKSHRILLKTKNLAPYFTIYTFPT